MSRMPTSTRSILTALVAATALTATTLLAQTPERVTLTGSRVGIWNVAGKITLGPTTGRSVEVTVTRHGSDAAQLQVAHGTLNGRETLRVIYPGDAVVYSDPMQGRGRWRTEFDVNDDGTFGGDSDDHWGRGGHRMRVSGSGSGTDASADLDIKVPAGQEIKIILAVGEMSARNIDGKVSLDTHGADVTATTMKGTLDIDTGSGDVRVDGMEGSLNVDVGSGDVTLSNVRGDDLEVDTGSGEVRGTGIAADALKIDTGSGGVTLDGLVAQDAHVDVGSGDVELAWTTDPGTIDIDSGSGDVQMTFPANAGATVDLESSSGDINSDFEIRTNHIERDALRGSFGDGRGNVKVETGSGDITVVKK